MTVHPFQIGLGPALRWPDRAVLFWTAVGRNVAELYIGPLQAKHVSSLRLLPKPKFFLSFLSGRDTYRPLSLRAKARATVTKVWQLNQVHALVLVYSGVSTVAKTKLRVSKNHILAES